MCGILFHHNGSINNTDTDNLTSTSAVTLTEQEISEILLSNSSSTHPIFLKTNLSSTFKSLIPLIIARGPNSAQLYQPCTNTSYFSSVLSLRSPFTPQPVRDSRYVIQFNGELYNSDIKGNDTEYLLQKLESHNGDIHTVISKLDGEFAYLITDLLKQRVYYGRDAQGKRSLVHFHENNQLYVSSVTPPLLDLNGQKNPRDNFKNCLNGVIYEYDLSSHSIIINSTPITKPYCVLSSLDPELINEQTHLANLDKYLRNAIVKRISTIQPYHSFSASHLYSILFSGGLDCTIVASLCALTSKSPGTIIDLLNVGFENPRTGLMPAEAPDRILARSSWKSLHDKYSSMGITFRLVEVDVPFEMYLRGKDIVRGLMWPKETEMDLSIAIAFYFASTGNGVMSYCTDLNEIIIEKNYQSPCKVLFSGLGADELYGGYHKFNSRSLEQLVPELTTQINGIHDRNLNRDDKVISANGVEVRYPYLDNDVITYSTEQIEINYKVSKYILREYASQVLDLGFVKEEKKRAIQFGAKSARMVKDGNKKGQALIE